MESVINLQGVSKKINGFSINDMNLQIEKGMVTGFVGENGAGKSTTIKLIMNLLKPDEGDVKIFGLDYRQHEKEIKERIGFVYDSNIFFEGMNLKDIKRVIAPAYPQWDDALFNDYINRFELPMNRSIKNFSKGMQMKASIALALSHHAELIVMDEPTAGLDPIFRRELLDLLQELMVDSNQTIFFSTHITTDLDRIADYIALIQNGKLLFNQNTEQLADEYAIVKGRNDLLDPDTEKYFINIKQTNNGFTALTNQKSAIIDVFEDEVLIERATLEDIMYYSKGGRLHAEPY